MRKLSAMMLALALAATAAEARAGVYSDDLGKCLVRKATEADQSDLVLWVFSAMSRHPKVKPFSNFTPEQLEASNRKASELVTRLLTEDCRAETVVALKYERATSIESAFQLLGRVAMQQLMNHPDVSAGFEALGKHMDAAKFDELGREAGVPLGE
ncbi:hypothetical protein [Phenylobacterium sp.]|uniref:hypothetical protein n=1 Tax=Phenylobacterium sp. TaxID=1871053 RepID=UPI002E3465B6|nr:hypothetical protein [Phenylobacterium sp.]HEX2560821.1 hypothetical protein [Phenylobacterium sp.]